MFSVPTFELLYRQNPWWPRAYSGQEDIENYMFEFATQFDLLRHISFNCHVTKCEWNEASQKWNVTTEDGETRDANFLISGIGPLHVPLKPTFKDQEPIKY